MLIKIQDLRFKIQDLRFLIRKSMKNFINFLIGIVLLSFIMACGSSDDQTSVNNSNSNTAAEKTTPTKTPETQKSVKIVDVPKLADRSAKEFDDIFGEPVKITEITDNPRLMPGEYREYKVEGHPKNLSVRFYKDQAKRFNLLLGTPEKSARSALAEIFKIDVSGMTKIKSESLSETWKGRSQNINYKTAYAKRSRSGGDFVMLHAEIE